MNKWLAPNAVRRLRWFEGNQRPIIRLLIWLTKVTGITSKYEHPVKYPSLPPVMRPCPHSEKLPVPKLPEHLTFSDEKSDSDEENAQQEGNNVDCDPTFEVRCSSSETHSRKSS